MYIIVTVNWLRTPQHLTVYADWACRHVYGIVILYLFITAQSVYIAYEYAHLLKSLYVYTEKPIRKRLLNDHVFTSIICGNFLKYMHIWMTGTSKT